MEAILSENTKKVLNMKVNIFSVYCRAIGIEIENMVKLPEKELSEHLRKFYTSSRNRNGDYYRKKTVISIRYGLKKYFPNMRIFQHEHFRSANDMFRAGKKLKEEGMEKTEHKLPLSKENLL